MCLMFNYVCFLNKTIVCGMKKLDSLCEPKFTSL